MGCSSKKTRTHQTTSNNAQKFKQKQKTRCTGYESQAQEPVPQELEKPTGENLDQHNMEDDPMEEIITRENEPGERATLEETEVGLRIQNSQSSEFAPATSMPIRFKDYKLNVMRLNQLEIRYKTAPSIQQDTRQGYTVQGPLIS